MEDPHDSPQSSLSDSQLHRILHIFPGVLFSLVQRPDGTCFFAYISEAAEALYELTVAEILADAAHVHQQLHPQDQSAYWQALKNSAVQGRGVCHQWRIITPSGQLKWIRWTSQAEVKENGEIVWDGIIEDITAYQQELETRQQLERELRDLGDRLSLALKSGDIGCWDWNIQENTSFWDQRMYELYGLSGPSPDLPNCEILNHHLHPEDRKATHSLLAQAIAGKADYDTEFRIIRADGEVRFIKAYGTVIRNGKGKARRIIGINFDITHQKLTEQALRESQQFVQTLLDTLPVYVFWKNRESVFLGCNQTLATLMGLSSSESFTNTTGQGFGYTSQELASYQQDDREVMATGKPKLHIEETMTLPNGQTLWIETHKAPLRDYVGNIIGVVGIFQDITEQKEAAESLRLSEERFRTVFENAPIGMAIISLQGEILSANQALCQFLGYEAEELVGYVVADLTSEQSKALTENYLEEFLKNEREQMRLEKCYLTRQGKPVWGLVALSLVRDREGHPLFLIKQVQDITERKQAEQALKESQYFIQTVIDTIPLPLFWKNQDSVFLGCNWPLARLLNLQDPQEIVGKTDFDLSPIEEQAIAYRLGDQRVIESGQAELNVEENHLLENGELQWIETHKAPLRDANQTVMGVVGVFQDITDRKNYEFQLQEKNQELQSLLQLREEALTLREDMSNMIVHDLRNPLSSILLSVNVLNHYLNSPSTNLGMNPSILKRKLQQISVAGQRLEKMIDSLLVMAKLESGKLLFNPVPTDLYQLGQMIHRDFELMANAYQVKFHVQLPAPERTIFIDETILRRVIDNLLTNAFKFSPKEGLIQLTLEYLPERQCRIQVADQGPGINKDQEQEIFKKFEIGTVKKNVAQIGLGLAFCKMAVEAQGGSLLLAPNEPQGSIFTVII